MATLICFHIVCGSFCTMVSEISGNRDCTNHKGETIYYLTHYSKPLLAPTLVGQEEKGTEVSFSLTVRVKLSPLSLSLLSF